MSGENIESRGVLRRLARGMVKFYYPRLEVSGGEKIPQEGPVLLCANHSNSMVDPVLIGVTAVRPVRFMAKAPLFEMPVVGRVMYALGMVPAYRGMDDKSQVRRNLQSLDTGAETLMEGKALGIFPEGKTTDRAHLDKVRSGAARMAIKAYDEGTRGVHVVPLGINYERKDQFRSGVWIRVGDPIDVDSWVDRHDGDSRKAMRALTTKLADDIRDLIVHLNEPEWEPWLEDLEVLVPAVVDHAEVSAGSLLQRKRIADAINHFQEADREKAEVLAKEITTYREAVNSAGLKIGSPVLEQSGLPAVLRVCSTLLRLMLFSLPAMLGSLWHLIPFIAVRSIASLLDQPGKVTVSTHRLLVGLPLYLSWYAALGWLMLDQGFMNGVVLGTLVFMPFAGVFALAFWRRASSAAVVLWHQLLISGRRGRLKEIRRLRSDLQGRLAEFATTYAEVSPRPEPEPSLRWRRRVSDWTVFSSAILLVLAAVFLLYIWFSQPAGVVERAQQVDGGQALGIKLLPPSLELRELMAMDTGKTRLERQLDTDEESMVQLLEDLAMLEKDAGSLTADKEKAEKAHEADWNWYQVQENGDRVQGLLRRFYHYREVLLVVFLRYERVLRFSSEEISDEEILLRAFLVEYFAGAVLFETSLKFIKGFNADNTRAKLNEGIKEWGIPPGFYNFVRDGLRSSENLALFREFEALYHSNPIKDQVAGIASHEQLGKAIGAAAETINKYSESVSERVAGLVRDEIKEKSKQIVYQAQKAISSWIGDFKPIKAESSIKGSSGLDLLEQKLEPGDIILERRNYYGSNAFLPGYWPHAALYVGSVEDMGRLGLTEAVLRTGFGEDLKKKDTFWKEYTSPDPEGHERKIIEAVSEGVIFSSVEHSIAEADAVAVFRPQLAPGEIKEAIMRAFSYWKRPYDFEFDFTSADKLVCTEVVYRAYGGNSGKLNFPVETIMGRPTMPAVNLVRKFSKERTSAAPQLEFIAFLEAPDKKLHLLSKIMILAEAFGLFMLGLAVCRFAVKSIRLRLIIVAILVGLTVPAVFYYRKILPGEDGEVVEATFKSAEDLEETLKLKGLTWWNYYKKWQLKKN